MSSFRSLVRSGVPLAVLALVAGVLLLEPAPLQGQAPTAAPSLRPYVHVFVAYALVWVLIGGWVVSIARRLSRLERKRDE